MPQKIRVTTAYMEFLMCPTIIVGTTDDDATVYARYRWGRLTVRLDPRQPAPNAGAAGASILEKIIDPEGVDGCMDYDDLRKITAEIIDWPEQLSPRCITDDDEIVDL